MLVHIGVVGTFAYLAGGTLGLGPLGAAWLLAFVIRAIWNSKEVEREVKETVIKALVYGGLDEKTGERYEGLRGEPSRVEPSLRKGVAEMFKPFQDAFIREAGKVFKREEDALEDLRRKNALGRDEKQRLKEQYEKALGNVKVCRQALADARRMVEAVTL